MDLTSLSSNLPHNNSAHPEDPAEDEERSSPALLMSAFKQAAYSVTALYKQANEQVDRARQDGHKDGYQECLDDIFSLLQRLDENGQTDPATRELFKQWALGKRRKLGPRSARREERELSSESDLERHRSSSPAQPQQQQEQQPSRQQEQQCQQQSSGSDASQQMGMNPPAQSSPAAPCVAHAPPQLPAFSFQAVRFPPPPETSDIELPDNDYNDSPPPSPRMAPSQSHLFQHGNFQQHRPFSHATNTPRGRRVRSGGSRQGTKRRMDAVEEIFGMAGVEKMQQHQSKKGRFQ